MTVNRYRIMPDHLVVWTLVALLLCTMYATGLSYKGPQLPLVRSTYLDGLLHGRPSDLFQDPNGLIWFCYESRGKGLFIYDGVNVRQLTVQIADTTGIPDVNISSPILMQDGKIWMGTGTQGIAIYHPDSDMFSRIDLGYETKSGITAVRKIIGDHEGNYWIACVGGLVKFNSSTRDFRLFTIDIPEYSPQSNLEFNDMHHLIVDPVDQHKIWIGTLKGLFSFDIAKESFTQYLMPFHPVDHVGFPSGQFLIHEIIFAGNTKLVAGTWSGGIVTYNTETRDWHQFRDPNVTVSQDVYFDLEQKDDNELWVCSMSGFGIFNMSTEQFHYYDSLPSGRWHRLGGWVGNAMLILNERDVVVSGLEGGSICHLENARVASEDLWPPMITEYRIDDDAVKPRNIRFVSNEITISETATTLSFKMVAPRFYQADSVLYRYQFIGYDKGWHVHRGLREVQCNLPEGSYELQYQASLDGNTWVDGESWFIHRRIAFWSRPLTMYMAGGIMLCIALAILYLVHRQRRRRKEVERKYQHLLAESEMSALRAQMNPHFYF